MSLVAADKTGSVELERMTKLLAKGDWILRADALNYLGENRCKEAADEIKKIVANQSLDSWIRVKAIDALVLIEGSAASVHILPLVGHKDPALRLGVAKSLGQMNKEIAAEPLKTLLVDENVQVRFNALVSRARLNDKNSWATADQLTADLTTVPKDKAEQSASRDLLDLAVLALSYVGSESSLDRLNKIISAWGADQEAVYKISYALMSSKKPEILPQLAQALAPFGSSSAHVRAQRIAAILDHAGMSSKSRPPFLKRGKIRGCSRQTSSSASRCFIHVAGRKPTEHGVHSGLSKWIVRSMFSVWRFRPS